ncbi:MAG: hypothetical protein PHV55_01085 [Candidatus Omnitrophica bacterium]|nr:hypothetical protein [Candidatus Omnitrophota bacterium]
MKKHLLYIFVGVVFFGNPLGIAAQDYSADVTVTMRGDIGQGKIFISGDKTRMETPEGTVIFRRDKNVAWVAMPGTKIYREQPIETVNIAIAKEKMPGEIERVAMGQESINGQIATKYRVIYLNHGVKMTLYQWSAGNFPIPVKTMMEDGWTLEYKNIITGKQPDFLFEIPAGYTLSSSKSGEPQRLN